MDLANAVRYRMAYGLAQDLSEGREHVLSGRWASNRAAGGTAEAILAEVFRLLNVTDLGGDEIVREAVTDALEGRKPRW